MNACVFHPHRFETLHRISGLGVVSCLCFFLNALLVMRCISAMGRAEGFETLLLMMVLVFVPPALLALGTLLGILGVSRQRQISTLAGLGMNFSGALAYFAWLTIVRG